MNPAATTAVDLSWFVNEGVQLMGAVFLAFATWGAGRLIQKFHLQNSAILQGLVTDAAQNAVNYALSQTGQLAAAGTFNLASKSAVIEAAAGYLATHVPDALAKLKIDPDTVKRLVEAKLAETVGTSEAPAPSATAVAGAVGGQRAVAPGAPVAVVDTPAPVLRPVVPTPKR